MASATNRPTNDQLHLHSRSGFRWHDASERQRHQPARGLAGYLGPLWARRRHTVGVFVRQLTPTTISGDFSMLSPGSGLPFPLSAQCPVLRQEIGKRLNAYCDRTSEDFAYRNSSSRNPSARPDRRAAYLAVTYRLCPSPGSIPLGVQRCSSWTGRAWYECTSDAALTLKGASSQMRLPAVIVRLQHRWEAGANQLAQVASYIQRRRAARHRHRRLPTRPKRSALFAICAGQAHRCLGAG